MWLCVPPSCPQLERVDHSDSDGAAWQRGKAWIAPLSSGGRLRLGLGPSLLLSELHQHILPLCVAHTQVPVWDIPPCPHKTKHTHTHTYKHAHRYTHPIKAANYRLPVRTSRTERSCTSCSCCLTTRDVSSSHFQQGHTFFFTWRQTALSCILLEHCYKAYGTTTGLITGLLSAPNTGCMLIHEPLTGNRPQMCLTSLNFPQQHLFKKLMKMNFLQPPNVFFSHLSCSLLI